MPRSFPSSPTPDLPPFAYTGRKLGRAVLAYVLGVIGVITLEPFAFALPTRDVLTRWMVLDWLDLGANVVLFLPLGFLLALSRSATEPDTPAARRRTLRAATLFGLVASSIVELTQLFEPSRYPSPTDVATNTLGATLGAWLFARASRRLGADTPLVGRLALELPLMGLVYLLVPLCALAALTVGNGAIPPGSPLPLPRGFGLVAVALFGGTVLGGVQRHHLARTRATTSEQTAAVAAAGFAVGALPALATAAPVFVAGTAAAALAAWIHGTPRGDATQINRRFETATLRAATPWLVAYLALVPLTEPLTAPERLAKLDVLHVVESLAAFTVLGYVLAEAWGRLELRYRFTAWRVGAVALGAALLGESLRRMGAPSLAAAPSVGAHVLSAMYGGWIYHMQRAHVRALVQRPVPAAAPPADTFCALVLRRSA